MKNEYLKDPSILNIISDNKYDENWVDKCHLNIVVISVDLVKVILN